MIIAFETFWLTIQLIVEVFLEPEALKINKKKRKKKKFFFLIEIKYIFYFLSKIIFCFLKIIIFITKLTLTNAKQKNFAECLKKREKKSNKK